MKSLFFVSSPLEMICAIEARLHFKTTNNILVLYLFDKDEPIVNHILDMSDGWDKIYNPHRTILNYGKKWIDLLKEFKYEKIEYLFTSNMNFSAHFIYNINYQHHFFIDDGTLTLNRVRQFKKSGNLKSIFSLFQSQKLTKLKHKVYELVYFIAGHKVRGNWKKLAIFTFFDIPNEPNISIVKNELNWYNQLKKDRNLIPDDELVYIIGTPIIHPDFISKAYYHELMERIKVYFKGKDIVYIPHRWEKQENIDLVVKKFNFKLKPNKSIIEIDFLELEILPKHIVGTISTALFTLKNLYTECIIYSTNLNLEQVNPIKRNAFESIQNFQKKLFIKI